MNMAFCGSMVVCNTIIQPLIRYRKFLNKCLDKSIKGCSDEVTSVTREKFWVTVDTLPE